MIHKLQRFSILPQRSDKSQGSVTSQYNPTHPLTRLQSEKLGIQPTKLPLPTRKRARKSPKGSDSETLSSSISNSSSRSQPPTPPPQIAVHQTTQSSTSPSQIIISSSFQSQISSSILPSVSSSAMAQMPWNNPGAVLMLAPLSQIPAHPENGCLSLTLKQAC